MSTIDHQLAQLHDEFHRIIRREMVRKELPGDEARKDEIIQETARLTQRKQDAAGLIVGLRLMIARATSELLKAQGIAEEAIELFDPADLDAASLSTSLDQCVTSLRRLQEEIGGLR